MTKKKPFLQRLYFDFKYIYIKNNYSNKKVSLQVQPCVVSCAAATDWAGQISASFSSEKQEKCARFNRKNLFTNTNSYHLETVESHFISHLKQNVNIKVINHLVVWVIYKEVLSSSQI